MWYNVILILALIITVFIGYTGYTSAQENSKPDTSALDQLSKIDYNSLLEQLPPPLDMQSDRPIGAMCYKVSSQPPRMEYTCPVCGEMTLYPDFTSVPVDNMPYYRNLVKRITKIDVKLDESQLCEVCNPKAEDRVLCLIVKTPKSAEPKKTCNITDDDINLLYNYSEGKTTHTYILGTFPINKFKSRLEELLGYKINLKR